MIKNELINATEERSKKTFQIFFRLSSLPHFLSLHILFLFFLFSLIFFAQVLQELYIYS